MKRIVLILSIVTLAFTSCSKSEDDSVQSVDSNNILLKKSISANGSSSSTLEYVYSDNKLLRININSGSYITHTYTGDLITRGAQYNNNVLSVETIYEYDSNNKMISAKSLSYDNLIASKIVYNYNLDGTIQYEVYRGNFSSQNTLSGTGKMWLNSDSEIFKKEEYQNGVLTYRKENTFDTGNSVFKNVTGFDKLFLSDSGKKRNLISSQTHDSNNVLVTGYSDVVTYNQNNYPTSAIRTLRTGSTSTIQYFYE
ncbi:hypothetical protein [Flavobacterium sp.]|uniref:hypothetical protein n=1 Tax=Flavobacterium sp. TaxID=239 RepID=UPI00374DE44E